MRRIGLTGGIATGKSTVARILRDKHQCPVIDVDVLARELVVPGSEALNEINVVFGRDVFNQQGGLDRSKMRALIANDHKARNVLNDILHPKIRNATALALQELETAGHTIAFVEAALLVEVGSYKDYDALWVVTCAESVQTERLMTRDACDHADARAMINMQMPQKDKCALASTVIHNDNDLSTLVVKVASALRKETQLIVQ